MSDSLTSLFTKEQLWAIHSRHSFQKSHMSELLSLLFEKSDVSDSLEKFVFSYIFDSFPLFYAQERIAHGALCSFTHF